MKSWWHQLRPRPLASLPLRVLAKPWLGPILALAVVIFAGALGYRLTEGWDWGDCLWMVLITISTIGYGEVEPLSQAGRLVTVLIIAGGVVVVQLTIQRALRLTESGYFRQLRELRFRRVLRRMRDHVIVCGYGRIGQEIASKLQLEQVPVLVVEIDPANKQAAEEQGLNVLQADATLDETLLEAGLDHCRSLVAALPSNAANLYVVLSAKSMRPHCRLISRADSEEAAVKLKLAGASVVVSPYVAAGRTMAATALRPLAVDFMDLLAGSEYEIEEFQLSQDPLKFSKLSQRSLAKLQLGRRSGAMVLAIRDGESLMANPSGEVELAPGQLLVVLGSKAQLIRLRELLGEALDTIERMAS
ncbi:MULTISPECIES: potassium channel family protein [unclassified Prochlorococcus]|uniref:potassium channel family protein n=1 Tax=unclassified Prochlorococcus TaxID=2627481 RepID=UPI0005338956|nr:MULTISPECIES: potassium channel protein [unclassified Prochlorococcus]KGG25744.1 putative potassium channel [Prochlorococcus sp. MIT 0701]KGG27332.1 putative potassium channel [Prochlorococcus sp. MIT 0702]KGG36209.1 putative potassium channel [Prochlorococcus sp. MIT 0703]